jgi:hypothetical protein
MKITSLKNQDGDRFLSVDGEIMPIGIAAICCDSRISGFEIKCTQCLTLYPVRELNDGGYCEACVLSDFEESLP